MKTSILVVSTFLILTLFGILALRAAYSQRTVTIVQYLPEPVTLYYKTKLTFWYGVTLQDGKGNLHEFGNISGLANDIGTYYSRGDTVKLTDLQLHKWKH
jgi:hypothetical protein